MIKAIFKRDKDNFIYSLKVTGHSESRDYSIICSLFLKLAALFSCKLFEEKNIVCSGVSALTQMVVMGVGDIIGEDFVVEMKSGLVSFEIPELHIRDEKIQILLESLEESFRRINLKYGESIIIGSEKDG